MSTPPYQCVNDSNRSLDDYLRSHFFVGLKEYKILKSLVVSAFLVAIGIFGITSGGDPTLIAMGTLAGLIVVNGFEVGEWLAVMDRLQLQVVPEDGQQDE